MQNVVIIRSTRGKVGNIYYIQPCPNPKTGRFSTITIKDASGNSTDVEIVKRVDSNGNIILTDWERNSGQYFVSENDVIEVTDGTTFNLDDPIQETKWKAIEHCKWIAKDRFERDPATGDLVIDGNAKNYGIADLYVERPGELAKKTVSKKRLVARAYSYIFDDTEKGKKMKVKVLGRSMDNVPLSDVEDYLTQYAEKDPKKIIDLYEGEDWKLHLFILEAIDRGVIRKKDNIYSYNDKVIGASIESAVLFMKDITNRPLVNIIKKETYPEYLPKAELDALRNEDITQGTPIGELAKESTGKGGTKQK